ncbi:MAG: class I SAM-dependent methyltransferase [Chloroflexi bacterium]|nr:class I SAM-dependent methyltransferase [Chloroflexota bacterium]
MQDRQAREGQSQQPHGEQEPDHRWHSTEHARDWLEKHGQGASDLAREFALVARIIGTTVGGSPRFADLGAGHGTLAEALLEHFPTASVVCLDVNPAMIEAGRQRLARFGNRARYVTMDLGEENWPADASGPFDAVVSSRAIHHVSDDQKRVVFGRAYERLCSGGWFLNVDYVRAPSEALADVYVRAAEEGRAAPSNHAHDGAHGSHAHGSHAHGGETGAEHAHAEHAHATPAASAHEAADASSPAADHHQGHHSHTSPVLGQMHLLEAVGFQDVDCFWKELAIALFGGRKP